MDYIKDFVSVYKKAVFDTIEAIKNVPLLPFLVLIYSLIFMVINYILLLTGIAGTRIWGFLAGLINAMLLSSMFYQLNTGITEKRLYKGDIQASLTTYMWSVYSVYFVFWIVNMLIGNVIISSTIISLIYNYGVFIALNPIGETIYLKGTSSFDSFTHAFNYFIENVHIWLPHTLVYIVIRLIITGYIPSILGMYFDSQFILFIYPLYALALILEGLYIVFRGVLFKNTINSTLRKRKYVGIFE